MRQMGLTIAVRNYFMPDAKVPQIKRELGELTPKDKEELVALFNISKPLGNDVEVVLKTQ